MRVPLAALAVATLIGASFLFRAEALGPVIDLNTTSADLTAIGSDPGDTFGSALAAGDINGDGIDDLIIGAHWADGPGTGSCTPSGQGDRCQSGEVYVFYGGVSLPPTIDLNGASADLTVLGAATGDFTGYALAAGDINSDGIDDLIIGAHFADTPGGEMAGKTYVIYGDKSLPATIDLNSTNADLTVLGAGFFDEVGAAVTAGDINGDGTEDLIIGAVHADADPPVTSVPGTIYVVYGGPSLPAVIDLNITSTDFALYGGDFAEHLGSSVATGDLNGDGIDDLISNAYLTDAAGRFDTGTTYVIYGSGSLPSAIDLSSASADLAVYGIGDQPQYAIASGDIDGDGIDDLIIASAGQTYVIYGSPGLPTTIDLDTASTDITILGVSSGSVAAGDIDGDGTDDLIIGGPLADPPGGANAGKTVVIYGGPSLPTTIDLNSTVARFTVFGDNAGDQSGFSVATGDINHDGTDDVIIGAPSAIPPSDAGSGTTYVISGSPQPEPKPTPTPVPKGNDDFVDSVTIANPLPYANKQDTIPATLETSEPQPCASIGNTIWFSFTPDTDLLLTADTEGSTYDTALAVYTGASLETLTPIACDDNGGSGQLSRLSFNASAGVTYHFQAGGAAGNSGHLAFNLPVVPTPAGMNVQVSLGNVALTFDNVTSAGVTTFTTMTSGPAPPQGYQLGAAPVYYDISTTASFTGNAEVCVLYNDSDFTPSMEASLRLFHEEDGVWVDVTSSLDTTANETCSAVTSLSLFTLAELIPEEDFDQDGCTNTAELDTNEVSGGQRDPLNFWDFAEQWVGVLPVKNGTVTVGDIGAVVARFGTAQEPALTKEEALAEALTPPVAVNGYHASADRAGSAGPNPWNLLPPNGTITVGDIGVVVAQFGHFCN